MQRRTWWIALALGLGLGAGCGGKKEEAAAPAPKTYKLSTRADQEEPPGGVSVTITWPAGWKETEVKPTGPNLEIAGAENMMESSSLLLRHCPEGTEGAACLDQTIDKLHDPAKTKKTPVGERVWVRSSVGKLQNGSLFVYHPGSKKVVECQTYVKPEHEAKLEDARKACESLTF